MNLLASSVLLYRYKFSELLPIVDELGYDGVEVWHFHLLQTGENPADIARLARQHRAVLSVHALSWDLNYTSRLAGIRDASLQALESSIRLAHELGAGTAVFHPGRVTVPKEDPQESWPRLIEGTQRLADYAGELGVNLSLEVMEHIRGEFFINPGDAARLLQAVPASNLSITFDTAHVPWDQELVDFCRATPGVAHIHISDCTPQQRHLPLGEGQRDHRPFLAYLLEQKPGVTLAVEGMTFEKTPELAIRNKAYWDRILAETGSEHPSQLAGRSK